MGQVTGYTAERMKEIEDASVVNGDIDVDGHLILTRFDGTTIDAGLVAPQTEFDSHVLFSEIAAPATPTAGLVAVYAKADNKLYLKGEDGLERELGSTLIPHTEMASATGAAGTSTSSTHVNLPVRCRIAAFTKKYAASNLLIHVGSGLLNNDPVGPIEVAVDIDGTDYVVYNYFANILAGGQDLLVSGLAAGAKAIEVQWRRPSATGTLVQTSGNRTTLTVTETF
jgi:hypothetical protein